MYSFIKKKYIPSNITDDKIVFVLNIENVRFHYAINILNIL